ncbi:hypothetical protein [Cellulomonas sp. NPDC058312]|uniref:hypothetical protein n=1 Tax=Cellulomonas sp. NPDC058312 TaxID=3346441 RepID=UPI0036E37A4E
MTTVAGVDQTSWFDWLTLVVTVLAAAVPAWIAIGLWRADRAESARERRSSATREFTHLLAIGDRVLLRFRDVSYFADAMGPGAQALLLLVYRYMDWDFEEENDGEPVTTTGEPRLDLSIEVSHTIARWNSDPAFRADLTEVALANGEVFPAAEDNRIISPTTRRRAQDQILRDARSFRPWLAGTRMSPARIRWGRLVNTMTFWRTTPEDPSNPLAARTYLEENDIAGDPWLRARTTADLEDDDALRE